eukprot:TRINITY_DN78977_c0_g1_i1.p1 TRINITY_DN78977_c0_g1~~TRINITY_DN78977_c0_g1_i1.p1  ORF type:complete len:286 (-),score=67.54 TRINITY_DN78977_c0_g1_i1:166-1023(-)
MSIGTRAEDLPTIRDAPEMMQLRDYVTGNDYSRYDNQAASTLRMDVTHCNLVQRWHDLIFDRSMTIFSVKEKLYRHGGTPAADQELYLRRGGSDTVFLYDDSKTLSYYGAENGMEIHIKDTNPMSISAHGGLEDVSQVQKYEMADEDYEKRANTVRAFKKKEAERKAREKADRIAAGLEPEPVPEEPLESVESVAARIPTGSRCEVNPGGRRGEVVFVGSVSGAKGAWVGINLDEPLGNNDGSKEGKKYFDCKGDGYGLFAKPENVEVGDFPERDPFASDDDDEF